MPNIKCASEIVLWQSDFVKSKWSFSIPGNKNLQNIISMKIKNEITPLQFFRKSYPITSFLYPWLYLSYHLCIAFRDSDFSLLATALGGGSGRFASVSEIKWLNILVYPLKLETCWPLHIMTSFLPKFTYFTSICPY